jgi:predicted ABC-type sugar transport system permease subunit
MRMVSLRRPVRCILSISAGLSQRRQHADPAAERCGARHSRPRHGDRRPLGRGIDISLIAALAVPPGLVLQMVQDGHSLPGSIVVALLLSIAFGLVNGWLIAYADVPSLFATLATGLFLAGFGQAALFSVDVAQWSPGMDGFQRLGQGSILGVPTPIVMFAIACVVVAFFLRQRVGARISIRSATTRTRRA